MYDVEMVLAVDLNGELGHSVRSAFEADDVARDALADCEADAFVVGRPLLPPL